MIFLGLELAFASFGSERFGLGRDGSEAFAADIFYDGGDQASGGRDGNADIGAFVSDIRNRY